MKLQLLACCSLLFCLLAPDAIYAQHDWPGWRGVGGAGEWHEVRLPDAFNDRTIQRRWEVPLGGGYSGIAVVGQRVFTQDRSRLTVDGKQVWHERVLCVDRRNGKTLWEHSYPADYGDLDHGNGPRATPTVHADRVFTVGAVGHLFCLDAATGRVVWSVDSVKELNAKLPIWGQAVSPVIVDDLVVVQVGARPGGTFVALDQKSGKERWRALEERSGYSTPILRKTSDGTDALVVWTADNVSQLSPKTGAVSWTLPFRTSNYDVAIISPVVAAGRLFVSGYWDGTRTFGLQTSKAPKPLWQNRLPSCLMATPLFRDGHLYVLDRREGFLCMTWETGNILWKDGYRLTKKDRNPHCALVWAGEKAVALNAEGELVLLTLTPRRYHENGRVGIVGPTWAHPAFSGQDVFARSDKKLVRVEVTE